MPRVFLVLGAALLCLSVAPLAWGQGKTSPYAGQQERAIKALSGQEIEDYKNGRGMGLAKAAELNHYPGPKHVLELAGPLELSREQRQRVDHIFARMRARAVALGLLIIEKERRLDQLFAQSRIGREQLDKLMQDIAALQGELRGVHLMAHLETKTVLSPHQIMTYDRLRGYHGPAGGTHRGSASKHGGQH